MSVAIKKWHGVESVDVSLEKATADVHLKPGNAITLLQLRRIFTSLRLEMLDRMALKQKLDAIGGMREERQLK